MLEIYWAAIFTCECFQLFSSWKGSMYICTCFIIQVVTVGLWMRRVWYAIVALSPMVSDWLPQWMKHLLDCAKHQLQKYVPYISLPLLRKTYIALAILYMALTRWKRGKCHCYSISAIDFLKCKWLFYPSICNSHICHLIFLVVFCLMKKLIYLMMGIWKLLLCSDLLHCCSEYDQLSHPVFS